MIFLKLAIKSLRNRTFATLLTVLSISLSVTLLLSVERARRAAEDGFTQTISKTDLIVGARSGPLQLLLYSVFNMGNATHNISYETYEKVRQMPAIAWTIPYSLGDGHRGFRVVGTNESFFANYHYRGDKKVKMAEGREFREIWDVVLGAEVARKWEYKIGSPIVIAHGVTKGEGILQHDDRPFVVTGIMERTGTPLDRAVYISLEGMEALHLDWTDGAAPMAGKGTPREQIHKETIKIHSITSFFVGAKSRIETLRLQREINNYSPEPLSAIIPGVTLSELWNGLSYVEGILRGISAMVVVVGFMAMLIALTTTLNERRREMAILRSIGATSSQIVGLLVFESTLLSLLGVCGGVLLTVVLWVGLKPWLEAEFGLYLAGSGLTAREGLYLLITLVCGAVVGLIPAFRAQQMALKDGLSAKV
ncbi:MAG: ABC transporter permease [Bdellovibrio sp.]